MSRARATDMRAPEQEHAVAIRSKNSRKRTAGSVLHEKRLKRKHVDDC
jgi:hypothetical protein